MVAIQRFLASLAPTTWGSYNKYFGKFAEFCWQRGIDVSVMNNLNSQSVVVDFLVDVSSSSARPKAILNGSIATIQNFCNATELQSPVDSNVLKLVNGLIKSGTTEPLKRTPVMPVQPFIELFVKWGSNDKLSLWALRLKAITLLSLTVMLRPSDIAPRSEQYDQGVWLNTCFCRSALKFDSKGYLRMYFFGIKNDYDRDGFAVNVPVASDPLVCLVKAVQDYVVRTSDKVGAKGAVFVSLNKPYTPLSSGSIAAILNKSIQLVGLDGQGFTAKCFRPTGATKAIEAGIDADHVQVTGRWKSTETFRKHYVHANVPVSFSDKLLGI